MPQDAGEDDFMLETERLLLRKWKESDAESLFEYASDPAVGPIAGWPPHKSVEESRAVIAKVLNGPECYAICEKGKEKAIGAVELQLNGRTDTTECKLGYPRSCVTLYMYPLLLMSSVAVVLDQHIKNPSKP